MSSLTISPTQARRLAITKQRLAGPRPAPTTDGIVELVRDLGCVQIDPIRAVERTQLLVLWSRLGQYDPSFLDKALWEERRLFEYFAHAASIVLTENFQIHRSQMPVALNGNSAWQKHLRTWLKDNDELRCAVIDELRRNAPLTSDQLETPGLTPRRRRAASGWGSGTDVSQMLSYLWEMGEVTVAKRNGLRREWMLTEDWLPDWAPTDPLSEAEVVGRAAQISLKALGTGTAAHIRSHFVRGHYADLDDVLSAFSADGRIVPVSVADGTGSWPGQWYVHANDIPLLDRMTDDGWNPKTTLLSPFDNLICDRNRTKLMWDFDFTMEIYVPRAQRKYGYYVLPVLHGDRLIGRIDPKMDRASGTLHVNSVHTESHAGEDPSMGEAVSAAVVDLGRFLGAAKIQYGRRKPPAWRAALRSTKA